MSFCFLHINILYFIACTTLNIQHSSLYHISHEISYIFFSLMTPVSDTTQANRVALYSIYYRTCTLYSFIHISILIYLDNRHPFEDPWQRCDKIFGKIFREFPHGKQIRWQFHVDSCKMMNAWWQPFTCKFSVVL